jgi:SAM-dependent MidA family methyltransferase
MELPTADTEALAHSQRVRLALEREIREAGGWIPFSRYMELALYAPGLGYYAAGARKFGAEGDFITAPELTPLFAQALAVQVGELLARSSGGIIEVGAGTGALAAQLLAELDATGTVLPSYSILELSAELKDRQRRTLAARAAGAAERVGWIDRLPASFSGVVLANEVLDVMPVQSVAWRADGLYERGVALGPDGGFCWEERPAGGRLLETARRLPVEAPYVSEVCLPASAWIEEWGRILERGALLLIDYGYPRREYYHPQRSSGTLRCHYRQRAHDDPFHLPGLNDITSHVDFSAIAEAGARAGLDLLGYCTQARFLMNCGILELMLRTPPDTGVRYLKLAADAQRLLSPADMGELFKVMALGRGIDASLVGFRDGDRAHTL